MSGASIFSLHGARFPALAAVSAVESIEHARCSREPPTSHLAARCCAVARAAARGAVLVL
jgi:hypothetical protein